MTKPMPDWEKYERLVARIVVEIKTRIQSAQTRAVLAVNAELIRLYWQIGQLLDARQTQEGWGAAVIPRLAQDIRNELPEVKGFSARNMDRMVAFARAYPEPSVERSDALIAEPARRVDYVLAKPPFGKKSSMTITNEEGEEDRDALTYERQDFWETTSNKQLNFLQHIVSMLKVEGKAAVVLPDNVLFEGGAGEKIRKKLLETCDVHTILRLPTGIFYAQGVKANVVFFDAKAKDGNAKTTGVWFYDLRTNQQFTPKTRPLKLEDLRDFIACYNPENRHERIETERFKYYRYEELIARDKASLDLFWLKDDSLDNLDDLPPPDVLQQEIIDHLEAALAAFRDVAAGLPRLAAAGE